MKSSIVAFCLTSPSPNLFDKYFNGNVIRKLDPNDFWHTIAQLYTVHIAWKAFNTILLHLECSKIEFKSIQTQLLSGDRKKPRWIQIFAFIRIPMKQRKDTFFFSYLFWNRKDRHDFNLCEQLNEIGKLDIRTFFFFFSFFSRYKSRFLRDRKNAKRKNNERIFLLKMALMMTNFQSQ